MFNPAKIAKDRLSRTISVILQIFFLLFFGRSLSAQRSATGAAQPITIRTTRQSADSTSLTIDVGSSVPEPISVTLNGFNVSSQVTTGLCMNSSCDQVTLKASDGLRSGKNVLTVSTQSGRTQRMRFYASSASGPASLKEVARRSAGAGSHVARAAGMSVGESPAPFLPPTVSFNVHTPGGWNGQTDVNDAWLWVGASNQQSIASYPDSGFGGCPGGTIYLTVVLDRQTLSEKSAAPESSPQCSANASSLKSYLSTLGSEDLAIVGTVQGMNVDAGLDLTPIGGTSYPGTPGDGKYPAGIVAIGSGKATIGSAYEAYYVAFPGYEAVIPFAVGSLQEDAYGNYNFQSSEVAEFTVSPNDTGYLSPSATSVVTVSVPNAPSTGIQQNAYQPPPGSNGYWLLTLSRYSLDTYPLPCPQAGTSSDGTVAYFSPCGSYYDTGNSDPGISRTEYQRLASDLRSINSWQLAVLTTIGSAAHGNTAQDVVGWNGQYGGTTNGFLEFSNALAAIGGTPTLTEALYTSGTAYTLITSPGIGGPLTGNATESTTSLSAQGQSGFVHGILQRNLNGLYMPQQTNQEPLALFTAKGGNSSTEFKLTEIALQQPVAWLSTSTVYLLPGADSIPGQIAAFRYLSVALLNAYLPGFSGDHSDDIHYFFTGSYNTSINLHSYDPAGIAWPGGSVGQYGTPCSTLVNGVCTTYPFGQTDPLVFTQNDFLAARQQLRTEIAYLGNTVQFLITGSNNMKGIIAGGSSNAGLALTGAAASILGSKLQPAPPETVVTTSWQNIVSMIGGVSSLVSAVPGLGEVADIALLATTGAKIFGGLTTAVGGAASLAAGAGGITSTSTSSTLPSAFSRFSMTVGELANGSMQNQLSAGFDTLADNMTSDWGRLSVLGPLTVNSNDPVFFSPAEAAQTLSVAALTQAAARSFYMALLPSFYSVHYWQGVAFTPQQHGQPDMGYSYSHDGLKHCSAFYLSPQENKSTSDGGIGTIGPNTSAWFYSPAGTPEIFSNDNAGLTYNSQGGPAVDYYVIAATSGANIGADNPAFGTLSPDLGNYLFSPGGLNLPLKEFISPVGPLAANFDAIQGSFGGHGVGSVCPASWFPQPEGAVVGVAPSGETPTTTKLTIPSTTESGSDLSASVTVTTSSGPVTSGSVMLLLDSQPVQTTSVNTSGKVIASINAKQLTVGSHTVQAKYITGASFAASSSQMISTTVLASAPDFRLSLSSTAAEMNGGSASAPINLQITSLAGFEGQATFTCTGLPLGTYCSFTPPQTVLNAGSTASSSLVISGKVTPANQSVRTGATWLLLLPFSLSLWRPLRTSLRGRTWLLVTFLSLSVLAGGLAGCANPSSGNNTGTPQVITVLVTATAGNTAKSLPLTLTVQ